MRRSRSILPLVTLLLVAGSLMGAARPGWAQNVGDPAPDFTYTTLAGAELSLSDYQGQVVFIFFFGNQCPFCIAVGNRTETEVNAVYASTGAFQAIGLDLWDHTSSVSTVSAFKEQTDITYPLCLKAGSAGNLFGTTYDRVMVIDGGGFIRYKGTTFVANTLNAAKAVIDDLLGISTGVDDEAPAQFALRQNYPNPFNPSTTITYTLPARAHVVLRIYDVLGHEVRTLVDGPEAAGRQTVTWDGTDAAGQPVASGVYLYRLEADGFTEARAMMLAK